MTRSASRTCARATKSDSSCSATCRRPRSWSPNLRTLHPCPGPHCRGSGETKNSRTSDLGSIPRACDHLALSVGSTCSFAGVGACALHPRGGKGGGQVFSAPNCPSDRVCIGVEMRRQGRGETSFFSHSRSLSCRCGWKLAFFTYRWSSDEFIVSVFCSLIYLRCEEEGVNEKLYWFFYKFKARGLFDVIILNFWARWGEFRNNLSGIIARRWI